LGFQRNPGIDRFLPVTPTTPQIRGGLMSSHPEEIRRQTAGLRQNVPFAHDRDEKRLKDVLSLVSGPESGHQEGQQVGRISVT
jgi:hypothetical protein